MNDFFKLKQHGTTVSTELIAGATTFFAMAYIIFVNPAMLAMAGTPDNPTPQLMLRAQQASVPVDVQA
jgi:AGZA family xanthine/uracil permease-like MFS transporter